MTNPRRFIYLGIGLLVFALAAIHLGAWWAISRQITLPPHQDPEVFFQAEQNWSDDERQWFYHETQGGAFELIVPFDWFMALEQPRLPLFVLGEVGKLVDETYITRFGFLPNPKTSYDPANVDLDWARAHVPSLPPEDTLNNEHRLPVGFARDRSYAWPIDTDKPMDVVGFTCAACHTGQINLNGRAVRVDGGPALTNLTKFELAVGSAVVLTYYVPTRFDRFADEVLGPDPDKAARDTLRAQVKRWIDTGNDVRTYAELNYTQTIDGFGRLDALGRIGNFVFAEEVSDDNWRIANAPVNYPPIWDTPWFDWVQYNASIKRPMVRNGGEAMGVFARADFASLGDPDKLFRSTVRVDNLHEIESLIRGESPGDGLRSPRWPEQILGGIDRDLAERGADLYAMHCQSCHHAAPTGGSPFDTPDTTKWTAPDPVTGLRYLDLTLVNLYEIGTDPLTARNFAQRTVDLGALGQRYRDSLGVGGGGTVTAGAALPFLVRMTVDKAYDELGLADSTRFVWNGMRPDDIRAPLAYKARPLNGVWATAPYLHNGSVPTLYQMISPHDERDEVFWLGDREFDPVEVGYRRGKIPGAFKLDTRIPGNRNTGHLFDGNFDPATVDWDTVPSGTIGPLLTPDDRWAIVEFLKTL